jgi:tRNA nucleotidyltransferase (CCA-adding enzyme)
MSLQNFLRKLDFSVDKKEFIFLKKETEQFLKLLEKYLGEEKIDADVFLGGSFAKGTLAKSDNYDADIFVRFDWKYENLSDLLEIVLKKMGKNEKFSFRRLHGSRDYFMVQKNEQLFFEIIPVTRIKNVKEARNVTDLSYFHVNYVKKNLNENSRKQLALAKKFFKANEFYGAESYIRGFSGYGLECLIIYYGSFEKMIKELSKIKDNERKIIDPAKHYKKKENVFFELNESKMHGPIILIDPTWKERNVLASLNRETFAKFQKVAGQFLKKPSKSYFEERAADGKVLKKDATKKKAEFLHVTLKTDRQEGDIAGTKMKKFSDFLIGNISKFFDVLGKEFFYSGEGANAELYVVLTPKKEFIRAGPPIGKKKDALRFKKKNKNVFAKSGALYSKIKINFSGREFLQGWIKSKEGKLKLNDMGITGFSFKDY